MFKKLCPIFILKKLFKSMYLAYTVVNYNQKLMSDMAERKFVKRKLLSYLGLFIKKNDTGYIVTLNVFRKSHL